MAEGFTLHMVQDEPYTAVIDLLDDDGSALDPIPAGEPRMQMRRRPGEAVLLDVADEGYLTREGATLLLNVPASVTATLPPVAVFDVWLGDARLVEGTVLVDDSVTVRTYP